MTAVAEHNMEQCECSYKVAFKCVGRFKAIVRTQKKHKYVLYIYISRHRPHVYNMSAKCVYPLTVHGRSDGDPHAKSPFRMPTEADAQCVVLIPLINTHLV